MDSRQLTELRVLIGFAFDLPSGPSGSVPDRLRAANAALELARYYNATKQVHRREYVERIAEKARVSVEKLLEADPDLMTVPATGLIDTDAIPTQFSRKAGS
ncbi:hypothetical protein [Stratiformator vulcanicus]|uniref:Uncharacterized protein n=1 Tax=Stratiformator vulcanicus TaxID=2527980 RepID=A0A517R796_9PLAN|nr:hypothetical protein [Stratiformator vulcanicus]QDT39760.1 hypothetical protein Pan189_41690 [Stratiformator vulcanicus]